MIPIKIPTVNGRAISIANNAPLGSTLVQKRLATSTTAVATSNVTKGTILIQWMDHVKKTLVAIISTAIFATRISYVSGNNIVIQNLLYLTSKPSSVNAFRATIKIQRTDHVKKTLVVII